MKPHYLTNKQECLTGLEAFQQRVVNPKDHTLAEVRILVREKRVAAGLIKASKTEHDLMGQINHAKLSTLLDTAQVLGFEQGVQDGGDDVSSRRHCFRFEAGNSADQRGAASEDTQCGTPRAELREARESESDVPTAWQALLASDPDRLFLVEIACSPQSVLAEEAHKKGFKADHDLITGEGVRRCVKFLEKHRPRFVWLSTECGPF